jgi:hypothetical protein
METLIVGGRDAATGLAERLADAGVEARTSAPAAAGETIPELAAALVALEGEIAADRPRTVVLADRGDRALAAALVATKLLVPVLAVADPGGPGTAGENDRLLDVLAEPVKIDALPKLLRP